VKLFNFKREIWLPKPVADLFPFFADAQNLETLTPPWVQFKILTPLPIRMHPGALIDYRLRIHGIPVRWQTEITAWEPPFRFVDEQKRGPYRVWIHEHRFVERDGGTLMTDQIRYAVYGGGLIEKLFVRRDVEKIFDYRNQKMEELFGDSQQPLPIPG
jgi:ligand-binding SRPBCC domain-containing protein